jgi:hypothetical protein
MSVREAYDSVRELAINTQSYCTQLQAAVANGGPVSATFVLSLLGAAVQTLVQAQQIQADTALSAAITAYVQQQTGNATLDVHAEFTASMTALQGVVGAILADYPKDANGYLLDRRFDQGGNQVWITLTAATLPQTMPAIANWLTTIA